MTRILQNPISRRGSEYFSTCQRKRHTNLQDHFMAHTYRVMEVLDAGLLVCPVNHPGQVTIRVATNRVCRLPDRDTRRRILASVEDTERREYLIDKPKEADSGSPGTWRLVLTGNYSFHTLVLNIMNYSTRGGIRGRRPRGIFTTEGRISMMSIKEGMK